MGWGWEALEGSLNPSSFSPHLMGAVGFGRRWSPGEEMGSARELLRVGFTSLVLSVKRRNAEAGRGLGGKIRCLEKIVSLLKGGGDVEVSNGR